MQLIAIALTNRETFVACKAGGTQDARACLLCPPPLFLPHREKRRDAIFPNLSSPLQIEGRGETPAKCLKQLIRAAVCVAVNELLSWLELRIYHLLLK